MDIILFIFVGLYAIKILLSHLITWRYFLTYNRCYQFSEFTPAVSIIKPVCGRENNDFENYISFCKQEYGNNYEVLFCVENKSDPAIPVVKKVIKEYPGVDIRLIYSSPYSDSKGKIQNMIAGVKECKYDVIIFTDADVRVHPSFIKEAVVPIQNKKTGLVFCPPVAVGAREWPAALVNVCINDTIINYAPYFVTRSFDKANGAVMVLRKEVIEEIGGFEQFGSAVAIDVKISTAIYKKGYTIHLLNRPARTVNSSDTFSRSWAQMLRWIVTLKHYAPAGVFFLILSDIPFCLCIIYTLLSLFTPGSLWAGAAVSAGILILEIVSRIIINTLLVKDKSFWKYVWIICILDFFRCGLLIHGYMTDTVVWRGRKIRIVDKDTIEYL